jgi:leucyl aminopeptidase
MPGNLQKKTLLLLSLSLASFGSAASGNDAQVVLAPNTPQHDIDRAILDALEAHKDPVDAYIALNPDMADQLVEPRLLHVSGEKEPRWATEGEKLRLKRKGNKFTDVTDYHEFYEEHAAGIMEGKASMTYTSPPIRKRGAYSNQTTDLPSLSHQRYVKPLFDKISTRNMSSVLKHMTSYYTRYFGSVTGEQSAMWLRDHISDVGDLARLPSRSEC